MKRRFVRRSLWILAALGTLGFGLSLESYHELMVSQSGEGTWCDLGEISSCEKAFQSEYSRLWGHPISLYGAATYFLVGAIAFLGLANGGPFLLASVFHIGLLGFVLLGATAYFAWALAFQVKTLCILCLGDYLTSLLIVAVSWRACFSLGLPYKALFRWDLRSLAGNPKNAFRTCLMIVLFVVLGFLVVHQERRIYLHQRGLNKAIEGLLPRFPTPWAKEFPTTGPDDAPIRVVLFGDYECPFCSQTKRIWNEIMDQYPGLARMTAVHTPTNSDCCPSALDNTSHPYACQMAYLALEILKRKGAQAFWEVHDDLYSLGPSIDQMTILKIGRYHGLSDVDLDRVLSESKSPIGLNLQNQIAATVGVGVLPFTLLDGFKISGYNDKWALLRVIEAELERQGLRLENFAKAPST